MTSGAKTPEEYLAALTPERAAAVQAVRAMINQNLPDGYVEVMDLGMLAWEVPLEVYPNTHNKRPLLMAALANQKNYISLYLNIVYVMPELKGILNTVDKPLKMGKSCINFVRVDDLPLAAIGEVVRRSEVATYIAAVRAATREE